ncbi:hypothetical protein JCM24511_07074 [Saitozyma sp. JCM 24511]|nr:hypothetical protein JCM24511_07074 [Saitozyma sp. JCM 24511]
MPVAAESLDEPMDKDVEPPSPAPSTPSEAVEEIEYSPRRPTRRPGPISLISEEDAGKASRSDVAEGSSRSGHRVADGDEEMPSESEPEDSENEFEVIPPKLADEALEVADRATVEWEEAMGLSPEELALRREQSKSDRAARAAARAAARGLPDRPRTLPDRPNTLPDPPTRLFAPPTFEGLRVWIDPNYKKLNKLSYLMQANASHIVGVPHSLITQLGPFADEIAKSGAKVVNVTWAWDSIHLGTLKPEQSHLIDLGATTHLVSRNTHQDVGTASDASTAMGGPSEPPPPAKTRSAAPKPTPVPITPLSTGKSKGKGKSKANDEMDTETLVEIFTRHQELFAKGKAVPEIARFMEQRYATYPALTWRNLLVEWRKKSDRFKGYGQPIAPAKHHASPAKIVLKTMPEPVHIHPTISYDRPSPIAPYTAHPPPVKAFMTTEQLDKIFREETNAAPQASIITIINRILAKHGTYAHQGWDGLYRDWRFRRGRFAHLAPASSASARSERYSTEHIEKLFRHLQLDPNMTESDRGEALAAMFGQYSKSEWADLYNDWVNKRGCFDRLQGVTSVAAPALASAPAPRGPDTAPAPPAPSQSSRAKSRYIDPEELVKILQEQEPLLAAGMATRQLAEILAPEFPIYAVGTWYNHILDFRARKGRFADVPRLSATRAASVTSAATTSSETKRNLEDAQTSPRKKHRNAYTEEEEVAMAAHVFVRLPMETTASMAHWADFQLRHPHRTVGAWAEHYRAYREKIGEYVAQMGGAKPARAGSNDSDGSDGSVQFIREGEDKSKRPHEVIEVLDSDSE